MKTVLFLLFAGCYAIHTSAQAKRQRLIAQADYVDTGFISGNPNNIVFRDSLRLTYSGTRHSEFDYNTLDYLEPYKTFSSRRSIVERINSIAVPNNVDSSGNTLLQVGQVGGYALRVQFDSLFYYTTDAAGMVQLANIEAAWYDAYGLCGQTYQKVGSKESHAYFFYANRKLSGAQYHRFDSGSVTASYIRTIVYDSLGNAVNDDRATYEFDRDGHYLLRDPNELYRYYFAYDAGGRVIEMSKHPGFISPPTISHEVDSFKYLAGIPGYVSHRHYDRDSRGSGLLDTQTVTGYFFHVNALGQKIAMRYVQAGHVRDSVHIIYNSAGNPSYRGSYKYVFNGGSSSLHRIHTYYYYEDYDPALSVSPSGSQAKSTALYPNPTTDILFLTGPLPQFTFVTDLAGRRLIERGIYRPSNGIDVRVLPTGLYLLHTQSEDDSQVLQFFRQ